MRSNKQIHHKWAFRPGNCPGKSTGHVTSLIPPTGKQTWLLTPPCHPHPTLWASPAPWLLSRLCPLLPLLHSAAPGRPHNASWSYQSSSLTTPDTLALPGRSFFTNVPGPWSVAHHFSLPTCAIVPFPLCAPVFRSLYPPSVLYPRALAHAI